MRSLAAEGRTVLFISHKLREIMAVSDRVSVMRGGRKFWRVEHDAIELAALLDEVAQGLVHIGIERAVTRCIEAVELHMRGRAGQSRGRRIDAGDVPSSR